MVGIGDFLTSIFCGAVVFAMIGYMAQALNKPIEDIVQSGTGLAFIVIPEGLSQMPLSIAWCMLFFAMLFLLGIDSQFAMVETVITYIFDTMRNSKMKLNKPVIVTITGILWFICGLPLCSNSGIYILNLMDTYAAGLPCLVIGLLEIFIVTYIYGLNTFLSDLNHMTGWKPSLLLKSHIVVMISTISPIVIALILAKDVVGLIADDEVITYGKYVYPIWAQWIGWSLALISIIAIPLGAIHHIIYIFTSGNIIKNLKLSLKPTKLWRKNAELNIALKKNSLTATKRRISISDTFATINVPNLHIYESNGVINPAFINIS